MAETVGTRRQIRYAPQETLNEWAGGVYRIPLPYPVAFDVSRAQRNLGVARVPQLDPGMV